MHIWIIDFNFTNCTVSSVKTFIMNIGLKKCPVWKLTDEDCESFAYSFEHISYIQAYMPLYEIGN